MYKYIILKILFIFSLSISYSQTTDTTYFDSKKIKEILVYQKGQIIKASSFKKNGKIAYHWDINKKTLQSYGSISYQDTLIQSFKKNCLEYTIYQHYGNGPLFYIENYKNEIRHGNYEKYSKDGNPLIKGQYANWKKIGIWTYYDNKNNKDRHLHWFHHAANSRGISIDYVVFPAFILLFSLGILCYIVTRLFRFALFYYLYASVSFLVLISPILAGNLLDDLNLEELSASVKPYIETILKFTYLILIGLSFISAIWKRKTKVKRYISIPILLISIIIEFWLIIAFALSGIRVM